MQYKAESNKRKAQEGTKRFIEIQPQHVVYVFLRSPQNLLPLLQSIITRWRLIYQVLSHFYTSDFYPSSTQTYKWFYPSSTQT